MHRLHGLQSLAFVLLLATAFPPVHAANRSFVGIPKSDFGCASRGSSAHLRGSMDRNVDNEFLLAEILDAQISIFVKSVFGLKTDVTAREIAGVI